MDMIGKLQAVKETQRRELEASLALQQKEWKRRGEERLRTMFDHLWLQWFDKRIEDQEAWEALVEEAADFGFVLPFRPTLLPYLLINILYSMKQGVAVHWNYKLIQVAHLALPGQDRTVVAPYLGYFWRALKVYGAGANNPGC